MTSKTFLTSLLLIAFTSVSSTIVSAQAKKTIPADMPTEILRLINEHRSGMGLMPLKMNELISKTAEKHSHNMATKKVPFSHDGFDERINTLRKQIKPATAWAENVAYGSNTAAEVVDMWLHSPGHRKNIEGNYNLTGIGIAKSTDGTLYYTQIFMKGGS